MLARAIWLAKLCLPAALLFTLCGTRNASASSGSTPLSVMQWAAYLGGDSDEWGDGIAVDSSGSVIVAGTTWSSGWVSGGQDLSYGGAGDAFVAKYDRQGQGVWSTYLGGYAEEFLFCVAVDGADDIVVNGCTFSAGWVAGGYDATYNGGGDAFVAKLDRQGALLWSTYVGGASSDYGFGVAVDPSGDILAGGWTQSEGWISGGYDVSFGGYRDGFVAKISASGQPLWSTYLGGANIDEVSGPLAVDGTGNVFACGITASSDWVSGGFDTLYAASEDAFVVKLSPAGQHLWSSYQGGNNLDYATCCATDGEGNILLIGTTYSPNTVLGGYDFTYNGGADVFVLKASPEGQGMWSTYQGGDGYDAGLGIATTVSGDVLTVGQTGSVGWVADGMNVSYIGSGDAFVSKLSPSGQHVWSTYLGGTDEDWASAVARVGKGYLAVSGATYSPGWCTSGSYAGGADAFVAMIRDILPPTAVPPARWQLYE